MNSICSKTMGDQTTNRTNSKYMTIIIKNKSLEIDIWGIWNTVKIPNTFGIRILKLEEREIGLWSNIWKNNAW